MLIKQIVESELLQLVPPELQFKEIYESNQWPKLFESKTVADFKKYQAQGLIPDANSLPPYLRLTPKATMHPSSFDVDIKGTLRYNPGCIHYHDYYELLYLSSGQCSQTVNGFPIQIQEGDLLILAPNSSHDYQILDDKTISLIISIERDAFRRLFFELFNHSSILYSFFVRTLSDQNSEPYLIFRTGTDGTVQQMLYEIYYECNHPVDHYSHYMVNNRMSELFIYLLRCHQNRLVLGTSSPQCADKVLPILQYIQSHYVDATLSELSELFHYTPAYISQVVKQETGKTFSELKHDLRLQRAAELLTHTDYPIKDISTDLGFSDQSHFTRQFRAMYGCTPKVYRDRGGDCAPDTSEINS